MSQKTVLNADYKGLLEAMSIPAELHERDGKKFVTVGSVIPIHCATREQVEEMSVKTHHYCGVFTTELLAPLEELAYVRLDENTAEKVFINRSRRLLLLSSDGLLAQWRSAPTFESANHYIAGTPLTDRSGALVSVVTAKRGNHYAVSTFEGEGGYFQTSKPWQIIDTEAGKYYYADKAFSTREELKQYIRDLPGGELGVSPRPVLLRGASPRLALAAADGRQLVHHYLHGVIATDVHYL